MFLRAHIYWRANFDINCRRGFSPEFMSLFFVAYSSRLKSLLQKIRFTGGSCPCTTENFSAHLEVRPPERKFFLLTGGCSPTRPKISAHKDFSPSRREILSAHQRFALPLPCSNFSAAQESSPTSGNLTTVGDRAPTLPISPFADLPNCRMPICPSADFPTCRFAELPNCRFP